MKIFFETVDSELCYPLSFFESKFERPFTVFNAIPEKVNGVFFCKAVLLPSEDGQCGKDCADYSPKNGKSGMCKHKGRLFEPGKEVTFK